MHPRAAALIDALGLVPHPEGGYFREIFRSPETVAPGDARGERSALTTIYFLLTAGQTSAWHRVASDEVWHFYEGDPLELRCVAPDGARSTILLGPLGDSAAPVAVVPAGHAQAAVPLGAYALVGCTVGPGFDFADFALIEEPVCD